MVTSTISPGRKFFNTHLETIASGKVDEMVDRDYTEDAVLITYFNGFADMPAPITIQGRENIKQFFHKYMKAIGHIDLKSLDFTETEDTIFFQANFNNDLGSVNAGDAWMMRDGKIAYHFGFWIWA